MTIEEKLRMYREKNMFVASIADAFVQNPKGHTVSDIKYEVWQLNVEGGTFTVEWIIVHFNGGAKSPVRVTGNSNSANYRAIGTLIDGGYYEDVAVYDDMIKRGYAQLDLRRHDL
jgi:hypothetical protein